jgi:hypothetical protein
MNGKNPQIPANRYLREATFREKQQGGRVTMHMANWRGLLQRIREALESRRKGLAFDRALDSGVYFGYSRRR